METNLIHIFKQPETWAIVAAVLVPPLIAFLQAPFRLWLARKKGQSFFKRFPIQVRDTITVPTSAGDRARMKVYDKDDDNLYLIATGCPTKEEHIQAIPWTVIEGVAWQWHKVCTDDERKELPKK